MGEHIPRTTLVAIPFFCDGFAQEGNTLGLVPTSLSLPFRYACAFCKNTFCFLSVKKYKGSRMGKKVSFGKGLFKEEFL